MIEQRVSQFKLVLVLSLVLAASLAAYSVWVIIDFNSQHAYSESQFLAKYTERAISRYKTNPSLATDTSLKRLGNERVGFVFGYQQLKALFPLVSIPPDLKNNTTKALLIRYRGVFKVPDYLLVRPVTVNGMQFYGYLLVDERLNDSSLDLRAFEKIQPAIFVALLCIFVLVIVELFHIHKVNSSINAFANWANQLNTTSELPSAPEFSGSKFNYLAFAIDKSLSGISQVLEQEKSFAKFTSHELRGPVAVLSANMELLELLMKDLSPQERHVLKNMESAVSDMKYQMEALLWLSREGDDHVDFTPCSLRQLIDKALVDNAYLLEGKSVSVNVIGDDTSVISSPVFLQIVLNNLVRNAYQNTTSGEVSIEIDDHKVIIKNVSTLPDSKKRDVGFGIGLVLVEKLVKKLSIDYSSEKIANGWVSALVFKK